MTALSNNYPTLLDLAKRLGPDGKVIHDIVEILDTNNDILDDLAWAEGNLPTGHLVGIRTGIPEPTFAKLYGFTPTSKSTVEQVTESCAMLKNYAVVDADLAKINGYAPDWMLSEQKPFIEGFNRKLSRSLFYANEAVESEAFTGLAPRYNSKAAENGCNIVLESPTTSPDNADNCSIWLMVSSPETIFGIYPKGSTLGLTIKDDGEVVETNGAGEKRRVLQTYYNWNVGLCVKDWRYAVRIQINQEDLTRDASAGPKLLDLMDEAIDLIPNMNAGRAAFYCPRRVRSFFRSQARNFAKGTITVDQLTRPNGARISLPMYDGIPIRLCDALTNTEAGISLT